MRKLVGMAEARALDASVAALAALHPLLLMEDASLRLWLLLESLLASEPRLAGRGGPLVALSGGGSNGGDALALLRHAYFAGHRDLAAVILKEEGPETYAAPLATLRALGIPVHPWAAEDRRLPSLLAGARLLMDGIAGTGLTGPLRGPALGLCAAAAASGAPVLAVDLPSGLGDDPVREGAVLDATWTASIEPRKACLYHPRSRPRAGTILSVDGVFPTDAAIEARASLLEAEDLPALLPRPRAEVHKGSRGRLGLFAGSPGMVGAAAFACAGAGAAGGGLVTYFADPDLFEALKAGGGPEALLPAVLRPLPTSARDLPPLDAVLAGPGWGAHPAKESLLAELLDTDLPLVLDADALRLLGAAGPLSPGALKARRGKGPLVLTPHPGEFAALSGHDPDASLANPPATLGAWAADQGAWVLLKAQVTWLAGPDGSLWVYDGSEPGLATAGSGDVLAGLIAGCLAALAGGGAARSDLGGRAARAGILLHGLAGKRARRDLGWFTAGDLPSRAAYLAGSPVED